MSGPKIAGVVLVTVMLGIWAVRSFVFDDEAASSDPVATEPPAGNALDESASTTSAVERVPALVVARSDVAGVPVGYPRSERGAVTAAVNWVASFPTIVRMGPIRLDDTIGQLLSERRAASGTEEVVADYLALIDALGPEFASRIWIESPLQTSVVAADDTSATVMVWALLTTGDAERGPVEALWRTHRVELVWERDDWRIDDVDLTEGPTPVPNEVALPSPASDFADVDAWEPAVFADTTTGEEVD